MRIRTCEKRERPSAPITFRLEIDKIDRVDEIARDTGLPTSVVLEKLVLYALGRVKLKDVTKKEMAFEEMSE